MTSTQIRNSLEKNKGNGRLAFNGYFFKAILYENGEIYCQQKGEVLPTTRMKHLDITEYACDYITGDYTAVAVSKLILKAWNANC